MPRIPSLSVLVFLSLKAEQLTKVSKLVLPYELQNRKLWALKVGKLFNFSPDCLSYYNYLGYGNKETYMDIFCKFSLSPICLENYEPSYALAQALARNLPREALYFYSLLTPEQRELTLSYFKEEGFYSIYRTKAKRSIWLNMNKKIEEFPYTLQEHHIKLEKLLEERRFSILRASFPTVKDYYSVLDYLISLRNQDAFDATLAKLRRRPDKEKVKEIWLCVLRSGDPNFFDHYTHYLHLYLDYPLLPRLNKFQTQGILPPRVSLSDEEVKAVYYGANINIVSYFYHMDKRKMEQVDVSLDIAMSDAVSPKAEIYFQIFLKHPGNITFSRDLQLIELTAKRWAATRKRERHRIIENLYHNSIEKNLGNVYLVHRLKDKVSPPWINKILSQPHLRVLYPRSIEVLKTSRFYFLPLPLLEDYTKKVPKKKRSSVL